MEALKTVRPHIAWSPLAIRFPYPYIAGFTLSKTQKIVIVSISVGAGLIGVLTRYLRRKRRVPTVPGKLDLHGYQRKYRPGFRSPVGDVVSVLQGNSPAPQRAHRQRSTSVSSSAAIANTGKPALTPQQLGAMGVESLDAAISYWEDALESYRDGGMGVAAVALPSAEEAEFCRRLETVLKAAYALQAETEHLFLHQHSVLFQPEGSPIVGYGSLSRAVSMTSVDSFVSAQEVANLEDFADVVTDESEPALYQAAMKQLEDSGIPCRVLRTSLVNCESDIDFLCKLHCVRLACQALLRDERARTWFEQAGRQLLTDLMRVSDKDPRDIVSAYDGIIQFAQDMNERAKMAAELEARGVRAVTFVDVVLDFVLMDAFEDLEDPPSSVVAVINNRWLSNGFKEGALATAVWSVLKAKRRKLMFPDGFISHFYNISEHLSPLMAWGFLGPESPLKNACFFFKDQVIGFLQDIFSFSRVRYTGVEDMAADIWTLAQQRCDSVSTYFETLKLNV